MGMICIKACSSRDGVGYRGLYECLTRLEWMLEFSAYTVFVA